MITFIFLLFNRFFLFWLKMSFSFQFYFKRFCFEFENLFFRFCGAFPFNNFHWIQFPRFCRTSLIFSVKIILQKTNLQFFEISEKVIVIFRFHFGEFYGRDYVISGSWSFASSRWAVSKSNSSCSSFLGFFVFPKPTFA